MTTAIITGGASGLGAYIMTHLIRNGINCARWDISDKFGPVDVANRQCVYASVQWLPEEFEHVDILVNCAGINMLMPIPDIQDELRKCMDVNMYGIMNTVQELLPRMTGGTICNIVSDAATRPMTYSLPYNVSKAAALMMTKQMARELHATHNMTVFSVSPNRLKGTLMSDHVDEQVQALRGWDNATLKEKQLAGLGAKEETDPWMVAEFISFLLSSKERHRYLNGCDIPYGC